MKQGSSYYYYHNDHLGTPQKLTSASGAVVWSATYSSFGEASIDTEVVENNLWFPGQYYDRESRLHYNYHRYYVPQIGRYQKIDPIGFQGGNNFYIYAFGSPNNLIDPFGLFTLSGAAFSHYERMNPKPTGHDFTSIQIWINQRAKWYAQLTENQVFDLWLTAERSQKGWWETLPKCPEKLCINKDKEAVNPNNNDWRNPEKSGIITKRFHPGSAFEMRTKGKLGPHGNQCTYDESGMLITTLPSAGSADLYSPSSDFIKHQAHDVRPYKLAEKLGRTTDYFSVRPIW
jgi:RHS repeat-associated protein